MEKKKKTAESAESQQVRLLKMQLHIIQLERQIGMYVERDIRQQLEQLKDGN